MLTLLAFLLPVTVLTLVPVMLGLERYVVTSDAMGGSMGRGSIVYATSVPVSDLAIGDVITFTPPGAEPDVRVTRRVVGLESGVATTRGDAQPRLDPWRLPLDTPVQSRVVLAVPWVGYPFAGPAGRGAWALVGVAGVVGVASVLARSSARRRRQPGPRAAGITG